MKAFLDKDEPKITGVLSCFDRMLFRGYLPIMSGAAMAQFLNRAKPIRRHDTTNVETGIYTT